MHVRQCLARFSEEKRRLTTPAAAEGGCKKVREINVGCQKDKMLTKSPTGYFLFALSLVHISGTSVNNLLPTGRIQGDRATNDGQKRRRMKRHRDATPRHARSTRARNK